MAALARVWLCTEDSALVRADRIMALAVRTQSGAPLTRMPDGDVRISVRLDGDTEGFAGVLNCPSEVAPGLLAELARVLTEAGDHPEPCAFVYPERAEGHPQSWAIASGLPEGWPG
jgi:hypothetical protein